MYSFPKSKVTTVMPRHKKPEPKPEPIAEKPVAKRKCPKNGTMNKQADEPGRE